jgi:NSS family neurotransmitter:Na+ symporter
MEKSFSSKIGVLLAAAGSAVGLGSIWKFPYVVGENGGGAFIILYIVCALVFGLPLFSQNDKSKREGILTYGEGVI